MAFREVPVAEICEVLRGWLAGAGLRKVACLLYTSPSPRD